MEPKRILLMYISDASGHYCASLAVEKSIHRLDPTAETLDINAFNYTTPITEKIINRAYLSVVRRKPEIWDYLYDNPKVLKKAKKLREAIHRHTSPKLKRLFDDFKPDGVICTQAYPCGMAADCKKTYGLDIPLIGILTDYAPHSYWVYDNVDSYIVPSEEIGNSLIQKGVSAEKVKPFGIPIDIKYKKPVNKDRILKELGLDGDVPIVLVMGGTQGLGPVGEILRILDNAAMELQLIVATGTNRKLYDRLVKRQGAFKKRVRVFSYADNIDELMGISTIIITKPGGITTAEALARGLFMLIVNPLPGQEAMNTRFLLDSGVAVKADSHWDIIAFVEDLLHNRTRLEEMRKNARRIAKPDSSLKIAKLMLEMIEKKERGAYISR